MVTATETPIDWEARYNHLCIVVDNAVPALEEHAHLLEITARRLSATSMTCGLTARGIRDVAAVLRMEAHRDPPT